MVDSENVDRVLSYFNDIRKRKFKVSIKEQGDDSLQHMTRKYNSKIPPPQYRQEFLAKLKGGPASLPPRGPRGSAPYSPALKPSNHPNSKASVGWSTNRGAYVGVTLMDLPEFIAYLEYLVNKKDQPDFNIDPQQGEMPPQPGIDSETGGLFDVITGEKLPEQWLPYQPDSKELEQFRYVFDGVVPGVTVDGILDLINGDPNASAKRTPLLEFKRKIRDGGDPGLSPEIQKELFELHLKTLGIIKEIQVDSKGNRFIEKSRLSAEDKILLSTLTARAGGAKKKEFAGLYLGRQFSDVESIAPEFYKFANKLDDKTTLHDRYGISFGSYTQPMADLMKGVKMKESDGTLSRDILNTSIMSGEGNRINRVIGVKNEKIMKAVINLFMTQDPLSKEELAKETDELTELVDGLQEYSEAIENNLPVGGIFSTEDGSKAADDVFQGMLPDQIKSPAREHIRNIYKQAEGFVKLLKKAGVTVVKAEHTGATSSAKKKDDFVIELPDPEDGTRFSDFIKSEYGLDFNFEQTSNLPISLKCTQSYDNIMAGAASLNKIYGYEATHEKTSSVLGATKQQEYVEDRDKSIEYFKGLSTDKSFGSLAANGIKLSTQYNQFISNAFTPITRLKAQQSPISFSQVNMHIEKLIGTDIEEKQAYASLRKRAESTKLYLDPKEHELVKKDLFNYARYLRCKKDPSLTKAFAYADLMSAYASNQEELLWIIHGNQSMIASNHNITKFLINETKPEYVFKNGHIGIEFKDKQGTVVAKPYFTSSSDKGQKYYTRYGFSLNKSLMDHVGIPLDVKENIKKKELAKEETIVKMEKFIKVIEEAFGSIKA